MLGYAIVAAFALATASAVDTPTAAVSATPAVAVTTPAAAPSTPIDPDKKIRCRNEELTGSLARHKRICMTVAEWRKRDQDASEAGARMIEAGAISCGECRGH